MKKNTQNTHPAANLGVEAKLWAAADAVRNNIELEHSGNANYAWVQQIARRRAGRATLADRCTGRRGAA